MKHGKHVILCVDDDVDLLDLLRMQLEKSGYLVEVASSAEEGLAKCAELHPDLVIADVMMEEVDAGASMVKHLRCAGNRVPVLLLSSVGDELKKAGDAELGSYAIFQKPVNAEALLRTIRTTLLP